MEKKKEFVLRCNFHRCGKVASALSHCSLAPPPPFCNCLGLSAARALGEPRLLAPFVCSTRAGRREDGTHLLSPLASSHRFPRSSGDLQPKGRRNKANGWKGRLQNPPRSPSKQQALRLFSLSSLLPPSLFLLSLETAGFRASRNPKSVTPALRKGPHHAWATRGKFAR